MQSMAVYIKISTWLIDNGFKLGIYGDLLHNKGCPPGIFVAPNYTIVDGNTAYIVNTTLVYQVLCRKYPPNSPWFINKTWTYSTKAELKTLLTKLVTLDLGCWT
jgi:hypothetical protein